MTVTLSTIATEELARDLGPTHLGAALLLSAHTPGYPPLRRDPHLIWPPTAWEAAGLGVVRPCSGGVTALPPVPTNDVRHDEA